MRKHRIKKREYLVCFFTRHDYEGSVCTYCWKVKPAVEKRIAESGGHTVVVLIGGVEEVLSRVPRDGDVVHFGDGKEFVIKEIKK